MYFFYVNCSHSILIGCVSNMIPQIICKYEAEVHASTIGFLTQGKKVSLASLKNTTIRLYPKHFASYLYTYGNVLVD